MPDPVESFTISVLASQGQSDCISAVASSFLETFPHLAWDISAVGTNDIEVPSVDLSLVLPWFQQNRLGYVNGACDLDLRLAPSLPASCGRRAIDRFSLWLGRRYPYAALHASDATSVPTYRAPPPAEAAWAYACSEDNGSSGSNICHAPYAGEGTCSAALDSDGEGANYEFYHLHLWYVNNDASSVAAKDIFHNATREKYGLLETTDPNWDCKDTLGHEQDQGPMICFLTGPQGVEGAFPQDSSSSSFATGTHSLYVNRANLTAFLPWLMEQKNGAVGRNSDAAGSSAVGMMRAATVRWPPDAHRRRPQQRGATRDLGFLLHPAFGCNFADHEKWGLFPVTGPQFPNNKYGIASTGDDPNATSACTALDPNCNASVAYYDDNGSVESDACNDPMIIDSFVACAITSPGDPVTDETGPRESNQTSLRCTPPATALAAMATTWSRASGEKTAAGGLDWVIVPTSAAMDGASTRPAACAAGDFAWRSFYSAAGSAWTFDSLPARFSGASRDLLAPRERAHETLQQLHDGRPICGAADVAGLDVYLLSAVNNLWQRWAVGNATEAATEMFGLKQCSSNNATAAICLDGNVVEQPYKDERDVLSTTYQKIRVVSTGGAGARSGDALHELLSWLATGKSPAAAGYAVDVLAVPVFSDAASPSCAPALAYTQLALRAGNPWPLNLAALGFP